MKIFYVYILASRRNGTLYIGMTSNLEERCYAHREGLYDGFTKKYGVKQLVYYQLCERFETAVNREKTLKRWRRQWKIDLIEKGNPYWTDLYHQGNCMKFNLHS